MKRIRLLLNSQSSGFLKLHIGDLFKGAVVAVAGAIEALIEPVVATGSFVLDWHGIGKTALGAAAAYLLKQVLTPKAKDTAV